jgi:anti-sigma factor RsiW
VIGHVGSRAGALIDGQLPPTEAERLWTHVHGCALCRAEVEREGWVKTQLAGLAICRPTPPRDALRGSLSEVRYADVAAALGAPGPGPERRRAVTLAIAGAGTLGAAMIGVIAMSVPADAPGNDRRPATSLTRPSEPASSTPSGAGQTQTRLPARFGAQQWERMTP